MKKLLISLTLLTLLTHQEAKCDNVVINGDTLNTIFFSPLGDHPGIVNLRKKVK